MLIGFIIIISCLFIDQFTKILARKYLKNNKSREITKSLSLYYLENSGGAYGIYSGNYWFLYAATILSLFVCLYLLKYYDINKNTFFSVSICVLIGGILGNFIDRIVFSYVTDFIYIKDKKRNLPIFNFADVFILIGTIFTFVSYIFI